MIFIISHSKAISKKELDNLKSKLAVFTDVKAKRKLDRTMARIDAKVSRKLDNTAKARLKAQLQPRRKDGQFAKPLPKPADISKNPLLSFYYPTPSDIGYRRRTVRLISATSMYLTGLEMQNGGSWQYKKYLQTKATDVVVESFNPEKMS